MIKNQLAAMMVILCVATHLGAQNLGTSANLQNIEVDNLTDEQLENFLEKAKASGYTEQQLEVLARARGMSPAQIAKLKARALQRGAASVSGQVNADARVRRLPQVAEEINTDFDPYADLYIHTDSLDEPSEIFGMAFFTNGKLTFEPSMNIPTPENYLLGPGDEMIIDIWGASEVTYRLTISPEGSILIPRLGPVYLNGLTVEKAASKLGIKLKSIFSSLGSNTFYQVSLGQIKTISVNVVGEVAKPGTYQLSSFGTAFNALYQAGGPSESGSLREIFVFRNGKKVAELDAYKFLIYGEGEAIKLQDQDVVLVKPYVAHVKVDGEVKRPMIYEVKADETLASLLDFCGGFNGQAYSKSVSLQRNAENFKTIRTVGKGAFESLNLQDGDEVEIVKISNYFVNRVRVEGAVNHPGSFELQEGMKLSDAIALADGLRKDAFLLRALIIRENEDLTLSNIPFEPVEVLSGSVDFELNSGDLIKIQSIFDLREALILTIDGEARAPGDFPFVSGMTVEDLILLAGGFSEAAARSVVEISRRVTSQPDEDTKASEVYNFPISENLGLSEEASSFKLAPFDLVVIRKSPFYERQAIVQVDGEVQFPGKYALESKTERISDLIRRSGGFTSIAFVEGASLIRKSDYFAAEDENKTVADVRREELEGLIRRDTLVDSGEEEFKELEPIGIELKKIMDDPGSEYDLILKSGDILNVPRKLQTVRVRGEVLRPGIVRYSKSSSLKQFVGQAGGFTEDARKRRAYVVYANGTTDKTNSFLWLKNYPDVEPGAEIIIPEKPERRKMLPQEVIGISTGLATLALIINNLAN
ncbi:SLBB domain-containing protein [Marinoscillum sp. MHG1-6]|uniref:SLBB domain-containing protein n=1 Tax=Marinoscillum sp. MHG1-6 TaxID=2959627 RepID=UPI0021574335|nr:SLBB domain-containing protein [Marinoscillum sp. MHG1-6]